MSDVAKIRLKVLVELISFKFMFIFLEVAVFVSDIFTRFSDFLQIFVQY